MLWGALQGWGLGELRSSLGFLGREKSRSSCGVPLSQAGAHIACKVTQSAPEVLILEFVIVAF